MNDKTILADLLRCAIQVVGRIAIPPDKVRQIVATGRKQIKAYNLCDGTFSQKEIVKKLKLDQGTFSKTQNRWVENGVAFWVGEGKERKLLHLYPIPEKPDQRESRAGTK